MSNRFNGKNGIDCEQCFGTMIQYAVTNGVRKGHVCRCVSTNRYEKAIELFPEFRAQVERHVRL